MPSCCKPCQIPAVKLTGPRNSCSCRYRTISFDTQWAKEAGMSVLLFKLVPLSLLPVHGAHQRHIWTCAFNSSTFANHSSIKGNDLSDWANFDWSDGVAISAWWPHLEEFNRVWTWTADSECSLYDISSLLKNFPLFRTSGSVRLYIGAYLVAPRTCLMHSTTSLS